MSAQPTKPTQYSRIVTAADGPSSAVPVLDLVDPANWAALIAAGLAFEIKGARNGELRLWSTSDTGTTKSQTAELWVLRAENAGNGRPAGRKAAVFTASTSGPAVVGKHPAKTGEAAEGTHHAMDDISLSFNAGFVATRPESAVAGQELSLEIDGYGCEYGFLKMTAIAGTVTQAFTVIDN